MTYKFIIPRIIRKAKHITTVSEFSKSEIQSLFEVKDKTISVIYNGIYFNEVEEKKDVETPEHFILFVGSLNPRKNIQNLIKAYELIPDKELKLLIVGKPNHIYGKEEIRANSGIQFMTDIDDYQLQQLYQRAAMLVMPSYYEGFGIPVIEALYHSCPVLCSKIPVFEELYNNFVYFCNPNLPEDIAANIHDIYLSDNKLNSLGNLAEQYNFISAAKIIAQLTK
jgi:glycosyltransferase involved in cell wall biosynthesis